jgi:AcrR family transcriptional regulator
MGKKVEEVVTAATEVFLRYGYERVKMADIAGAAHMSRPALYLVFPSKEEIFTAVLERAFAANLDEIRQGLSRFKTTEQKLTFAFDVWSVHPFEMILASPDARDLYESSFQFATDVTTKAHADFVSILAEVLDPLVQHQAKVKLTSVQIAQMLARAVPGFKGSAKTTAQLRELIARLITVVLASLGTLKGPRIVKRNA